LYTLSTQYFTDTTSTATELSGAILAGAQNDVSFDFASSSISNIVANISIDSAINDVLLLYDRQLLIGNSTKHKILTKYEKLKIKVRVIDALITLASKARGLEKRVNKLKNERQHVIIDSLTDINELLLKLRSSGKLKQLGYDIIKANNDYLINNWQ